MSQVPGDFSFPALPLQSAPAAIGTHQQQLQQLQHQQQQQQVQHQTHVQQQYPPIPLTAQSTVVHARSPAASSPIQQRQPEAPVPMQVAAEGRRNKVPLEKGFSQVSWLKLSKSDTDLTGGAGRRRDIPAAEVKQHNTADDAWIVLHGKVYNITPYLRYHPGGPDILIKAAGRDATSLFNKYHPWVNAHALLEKCLIGLLHKPEEEGSAAGSSSGKQGADAGGQPSLKSRLLQMLKPDI